MNEDEELIIDEDIDFDEEFSELEIKKSQYSFQQIKDIYLTNPLYKRRYFRDDNENILNICYNCKNFQAINALLTRHSARRKYQFSYTLIMAIICNPHIEEKHKCHMIDKLVKLGTEINHANIFGETALYFAVLSHQKFVVECLLKNGANPNIEGNFSISPLMIACYFADFYTASLLIHYEADLNTESSFPNWKVLDFAMLSENPDFESMLRELGAKGGIGYDLLT